MNPASESLSTDADGNLKSDGRWLYTWDADNQLVIMEEKPFATLPATGVVPPPRQRLEFVYDYQHRRSAKKVFRYDSATGSWQPWSYTLFLYDGWNLVAELDATMQTTATGTGGTTVTVKGTPQRLYVWGNDLSGSKAGAGGVGGLLLVKHVQKYSATVDGVIYRVQSDVNGNVAGLHALTGPQAGKQAALFDYDPFGRRIYNTLPMNLEACPVGFSSKYTDKETGLCYYGFRYYSPELGRWLNRDPIAENGGLNLYGMVRNDPVNQRDMLGLAEITKRDCAWWVIGAHEGDPMKIVNNFGYTRPGDRFAACSCGSNQANQNLQNQGRGIPNSPGNDRYLYPDPANVPKGYPEYDPAQDGRAMDELLNSIANAETQIEAECGNKDTCCKKITLKVHCDPSGRTIKFSDFVRSSCTFADKNPCNYENTYDCKTKAWSGDKIIKYQTAHPEAHGK